MPPVRSQERSVAKSLMETSDGRPSTLAHSLSAPKGGEADGAIPQQRTAAEAIAMNGAAGRLMTKEERKRLEEAIDKSESLEGERRLLRCWEAACMVCSQYSPNHFHFDRDPKAGRTIALRLCHRGNIVDSEQKQQEVRRFVVDLGHLIRVWPPSYWDWRERITIVQYWQT